MRILFISRSFPDDIRTKVHGIYKRMGMFIEALKGFAELDMLFYVSSDSTFSTSQIKDLESSFSHHWNSNINLFLCPMSEFNNSTTLNKLLSFGKGIVDFHEQPRYAQVSGRKQVQAFEQCLSRKPDAIFAHRLSSMCPLLLTSMALPQVYFDMDDVEHVLLARSIRLSKSLPRKFLYLLLPALKAGESKAIQLATETYVCSDQDRSYLAKKSYYHKIVTIPNAVTIPKLQTHTREQTILFLGSNYSPNIGAVNFLIKSIWPHIHNELPHARLIIAGVSIDRLDREIITTANVQFPGFVDDLDQLYERARVVVAPILTGSGTRVKIIEAASYGKPVVSTRLGAEGIDLSDGTEIQLRDNPVEFARACINLLVDPHLCEQIGLAARTKVIKNYDRDKVIQSVRQRILNSIVLSAT